MLFSKRKISGERVILSLQRTVCYLVLLFLTVLCLFSFYILIVNATRAHPDIMKGFTLLPGKSFLTNWKNLMANQNLPVLQGIGNSLFISACSALLSTYFSALAAFGIHAYNFKFRNAAFTFILLIMMVPSQVSTLGLIRLMGQWNLMDTFVPLILPSIASASVFFFMKQYLESMLPIEIVESARIDGASEFRTFNSIVLPIMKPALAVQAIFSFVNAWNNYFLPSLIITSKEKKTLPILIAQLRSADFLKFDLGQVYMLIAVAIIPVLIMYLFLSRYIVRGITLGSVKG